MTSKNTSTVKPQQALEEQPAPAVSAQAEPVEPAPVAEQGLDEEQKDRLQRALLTPLQRQALELKAAEPGLAEPQTEDNPAASVVVTPSARDEGAKILTDDGWLENGRPYWAQERFECLLFSVAGLKLAVPLVCLGGIHAIQERDKITPL